MAQTRCAFYVILTSMLGLAAGCGGNGVVDRTAPVISDCTVNPGFSSTGPFVINANVSDDGGVAEVYAIVALQGEDDGEKVVLEYQSESLYSVQYTPALASGVATYSVNIYACDNAGNTARCATPLGFVMSASVPEPPLR